MVRRGGCGHAITGGNGDHGSGTTSEGAMRFGLAEVYNPSMLPTLCPGDQLLLAYGARVRPGHVVVLRHPFQHDLLIVKRAAERREGGWWVLGDNARVTNDSREFGVVPDGLLVARAVLRLRSPLGAGQRSDAAGPGGVAEVARALGDPEPAGVDRSGAPSRVGALAGALGRLPSAVRPLTARSRRLRAR
ncbi:nickel-type superoxide dismutase maturation protease [Streptomyces sp. 3MP-14]|uniref:Nickel-type superoxide dismutase maturation protease n=1 Tax=Streptomyces mimosae TaxID=2586635 RepID=A0A5N6AQU5_9ACTN|nr:nickel-type superoxide dismutase maturation protease [Streptomyces mimosae]KAB8179587.1 nickel-type superoxide dismutase maturation protease [Streptomyces sp. 3MP-14]